MHHYPYNDRPEPTTDENYYSEICVNAGILQLPRTILDQARNQYESIFSKDITNVSSKITQRKMILKRQNWNLRNEEKGNFRKQ